MMILRISATSPYARKVRIGISVMGLQDQVRVSLADTYDPSDEIRTQNPLGKVPTLLLDDGSAIYDSLVILEFLNDLAGSDTVIPKGSDRISVLLAHALASGMTDAALLQAYEKRWRSVETHSDKWLEHQAAKVDRALDAMEAAPFEWSGRPHIGAIAKACGLGFLDLRFGAKWRETRPKLDAWLGDFSRRVPAYEATAFKG
jgi:glutathione S-transferase